MISDRWYSITEDIPLYDAPLPQSKRELFRSLTIEEPPPPKAVYFNRITTLDTRISCVLVYWATRGNTHILTQCTRWYDITQHQQEREKLIIKEMSRGELSSKYLVWVQLLLHSEEKSKIIQDEQEYYSIHDPSRHFREMELKSLATKELVISDELDEDDLSDNSDSENEGSDEEEEEEEEEDEEEEANLSEDSISNSKIPQNHRKIFLKPRHKKIYQQMLDDRYAMALLHLTASEYIDETNIPPDFILYEDSQKISKE